jgi:hypothetical protein
MSDLLVTVLDSYGGRAAGAEAGWLPDPCAISLRLSQHTTTP